MPSVDIDNLSNADWQVAFLNQLPPVWWTLESIAAAATAAQAEAEADTLEADAMALVDTLVHCDLLSDQPVDRARRALEIMLEVLARAPS